MRRALGVAIVVFTVGAPSSTAEEKSDFSHDLHVNTMSVECTTCHPPTGLPIQTDVCVQCHESGPPAWKLPAASRRLDVRMPHAKHAGEMPCETCHAKIASDEIVAGAPVMPRSTCVACHAEKGVKLPEDACVRCHGEDRKTIKPASHDASWTRRHGLESLWAPFAAHGSDCAQCHTSATCKGCHDQRPPADHNGLWRERTHGIAAGFDRDRCQSCHEPGTCVRCHEVTPPINHVAGWQNSHGLVAGAVGNESCDACHQPSFCVGCHTRKP